MHPSIRILLSVIDQAYGARGWQGTTLRGSLRGVTPTLALWRPMPKRHNIWELTLHTAYWKYIVRRRLTGDHDQHFPRQGSNWFPTVGPPALAQWNRDVALLRHEHELLRKVVAAFSTNRLHRRAPESKWTYGEHIWGIAAHDAYHTGQIQLLKKLHGKG